MSDLRQEERDEALPQDGDFANESDLHPSDRALAGIDAEGEGLQGEDRQAGTLADDDATLMDVGTEPRSEETAVDFANDDQETVDGLDELEESVREQAEDKPVGSARDFEP